MRNFNNEISMRFIFAVALSLVAYSSQAATLSVTLTPSAKFDGSFTPIPLDLTTAGIFQMDIAFEISDFGPDERNFGNLALNTLFTGPAGPLAGGFAYSPSSEEFDLNGGLPGGEVPLFETNVDAGVATPGDLQGILASLAGGLGENDPRSSLGEAGPTLVGSIFVDYDGSGPATVQLGDIDFGVVLASTGLISPPSQAAPSNIVSLGEAQVEIPEPATFGLVSLAMAALGGLRRRR